MLLTIYARVRSLLTSVQNATGNPVNVSSGGFLTAKSTEQRS